MATRPVSIGASIFERIGQELARQAESRRNATLDGIEVQSKLAAIQRAEQEARRQAEQDARQARQDAEQRADRLASINGPSTDLSPDTAAILKQAGYNVDSRTTLPARTLTTEAAPGVIVPGQQLASQGYSRRAETFGEQLARQQREAAQGERDEARRFRDEQASEDRAFRGEQSALTREAATERANADRELRQTIAETRSTQRLAITPTAEAAMINRLQTQWDKAQSSTREMNRQYSIMRTGLERFRQGDRNGGSQAVLITFQKILDPTSVVRESEYARSAEGVAMMQRMQGYAERIAQGGAGVPDAALAEMVATAQMFMRNLEGANRGIRQRAGRTADRYGIPHDLVFDDAEGDPGSVPPSAGNTSGNTGAPPVRRFNPATMRLE